MKIWKSTGALLALLLLCLTPNLRAQGGVAELHTNAVTAMSEARRLGMPEGAAKWNEALGYLREATNTYDDRAPQLYGPKFGWFWYFRGTCELRLGKFEEAIESFKTCYEKYSNEGVEAGEANVFNKKALLKWGEAAQGQEDWETAITQYKKFLAERNPDNKNDNFEKGAFYINMAICHFKAGKIAGGTENLQIAIKNKNIFPTPPAAIMAGFQAFAETAIAKKDEEAMLDFLKKNRADVTFQPWEAAPFSPIFMQLAAAAMGEELKQIAFELYALVPGSLEVNDSLRTSVRRLGGFPREVADGASIYLLPNLEKQLTMSAEREKKGQRPEVTALAATAFIHEKEGNVRGAYVAYRMLEELYSDAPRDKRENYLYQLIRTSSIVGRVLETEQQGQKFLKLFPGSQYEESVRSLMLTGLFFDGEYELCITVATTELPKLEKNTKQHDICLHVLGGSYFYTGQFQKALPFLEQHLEEYPESDFKIASEYFHASNYAQLQVWGTAAELLDKFLNKYPNPKENAYIPFAMYDRANCHFAEGELDESLAILNKLESEFPDASNRELVFNLKGNVLQNLGNDEEAVSYYERALALAERKQNDLVSGEALFYLVALLGQEKNGNAANEEMALALPYYDKFWEKYGSESPYKAQVAVAGLPALEEAGRIEEGLDRLQAVISQLAKIPGAFGLEEAINSFTKFYLMSHTEEELKDLYYDFPDIRNEDRAAQALLRIALITVFENKSKQAEKEDDDGTAGKANAMITVLFRDLKSDFELKTLSNFILVSVGDYLRERTSSPKEAIPYYEEVLSRRDQSYRFPASFGLADVYALSDSDADLEKAVTSLLDVSENSQDRKQQEKALYRAIEVLAKMGKWEEAKERAKDFLKPEKNFNTSAPFVSLVLGRAYQQLGETENAIATFGGTYASYTGLIAVSAPSLKNYMELLWTRNKPKTDTQPSDRQFAYKAGATYIQQTAAIRNNPKVPEEERALWDEVQELVRKYEANPNITPLSAEG